MLLRDGWLHTGDVARMDEDGYFYIVDRLKDMVIVSGFKVFTRRAGRCPVQASRTCRLAGIGGRTRSGTARIRNELPVPSSCRPGIEKSAAEKEKIIAFLKENVAPYKVPKVIDFMDELPTSGVGKILKREIKKMMDGQDMTPDQ
ncbi:MAG: AMP-binding protein [Desulfobacterales bacterium]|nr:AMP-binding protein [Desulfobacterales bacterium]